jgi:hypothetical protein
MPSGFNPSLNRSVTAVSRSVSGSLLETSFVPVCWARAARAVVVALKAALRMEESHVRVANARSAAESAASEWAHSGWAQADCSAELRANRSAPVVDSAWPWADDLVPVGWAQADCLAELRANGSSPVVDPAWLLGVDSVPVGWAQADYSAELLANDLSPADYWQQVDLSGWDWFPGACPVCWPMAELRRDSRVRYKASRLVSRERWRGR